MSDFFETDKELEAAEEIKEEESFLFNNPVEHNDKKVKSPKKKRLKAIISAALAVVILAGGTLAVVELIPEKKDEEIQTETPSVDVLSYEVDDIKSVSVANEKGTFNFLSYLAEVTVANTEEGAEEEEKTETQKKWYLGGYSPEVCSSEEVKKVVSVVSKLMGLMTVDTKTPSECGFDTPRFTASVETEKDGKYNFYVGSDSPDGMGTYVMTSKNDKIYVVESHLLSDLDFTLTDFADDAYITAATFKADISKYKDDEGNLISFDYVKISGNNYPQAVTVIPNTDNFSQYINYKVITPMERYADNIGTATNLFTTTTTVAGGYTFDVSEASLKEYRLDKPDVEVNLCVAGEIKTFKISKVDDNYCAVITDDSKNIKKVATSYLKVFDSKASDFYYAPVAVYSVLDFANFSVTTGGSTYSFDIKVNSEENAKTPYSVTSEGKEIDYEGFNNFYSTFVGLTCSDFGTEKLTASPDASVNITFKDGRENVTMNFTKYSATKYQYSINGVDMGRITSSSYNKFIKNLKLAAENKKVK